MSLLPSFPSLPRTGIADSIQTAITQSSSTTTIGQSPNALASLQTAAADTATAARNSTMGVYVADLDTKAFEGMKALGSKFGDYLPFTKAGAKTPTFAETATAAQLTAAASGAMGSTFGGAGLYSDAVTSRYTQETTAQASAAAINQAQNAQNPQDDRSHIVTLTPVSGGLPLEFLVMPEIVEDRAVDYEAVAPPQFPGAFQKYKGTQSVAWSINATLISRTTDEATQNLRNINRLRGWTMPFFGMNTFTTDPTRLGAPPEVLLLKGLRKGMIGEVPVVITSLNWTWPRDVDYIPAYDISPEGDAAGSANIPFPTVMQISIRVVESFSTTQFNQFDLRTYQAGDMIGAYSKPIAASAGAMTTSSTDSDYSNEGRNNPHPTVQEAQTPPNPAARVGTELGRPTTGTSSISERVTVGTAISGYNQRLPISPTAQSGNVEDLSPGP